MGDRTKNSSRNLRTHCSVKPADEDF